MSGGGCVAVRVRALVVLLSLLGSCGCVPSEPRIDLAHQLLARTGGRGQWGRGGSTGGGGLRAGQHSREGGAAVVVQASGGQDGG